MKSLKMFAIAVMAFAVMATGVHAASCTDSNDEYSRLVDGKLTCYADLSTAIRGAGIGDTIKLEADAEESSSIEISQNITIDLNGKSLKFTTTNGAGIIVNGAKLTLKGTGTVENVAAVKTSLITVNSGATLKVEDSVNLVNNATEIDSAVVRVKNINTNNTTVYFEKGVVATSKLHGLVVGDGSTTTAQNIDITMNGTWTTDAYVVKVNGYITKSSNPVKITIAEGTYTSNKATALYASGYAEWDIDGGTVKGSQAVAVRSGKVDISGGSYTATNTKNGEGVHDGEGNHAIAILGDEKKDSSTYHPEYMNLIVSGGTFTANTEDAYAIYVGKIVEGSKLAISGGTFTSGKDSVKGTQLPAMYVNNASAQLMFENHKDMITGGTFTGGVVGEITVDGVKYTDEEFTAELVKGDVNTNTPADEQKPEDQTKPEDQGNTGDANTPADGTTGRLPDEPAKTNDNILVYAGLGLVSALTVSFSAKRKENN